MKKIINWLKYSNRWKHLLYGMLVSLIAGIEFTCGVAAGMEYKDNLYGNRWDWIDFSLTIAGGLIGYVTRSFILKMLGVS